ncbi:response regulator [Geobacter sp. SVR]|uniref:response regulator n=1 Tax=Geobacter sp. SVR TaxID=2495594 RepID=UPI00143EF76B|nr:response regulator [Geobacter sp. SVR]BCS52058.1 response regulator [Geobacter sp. SVR]GCF86513.1 response regulator [Geobacter sp. SVR]
MLCSGSFTASDKAGILIVDDNWDHRRLLAVSLAMEGYRATCAANASEALVLLKSTSFCLMLTDYNMPGMNGLKLSEEALKTSPGLVIVMITGGCATHLHQAAEKLGITAVLTKPLDVDELFGIIARNAGS